MKNANFKQNVQLLTYYIQESRVDPAFKIHMPLTHSLSEFFKNMGEAFSGDDFPQTMTEIELHHNLGVIHEELGNYIEARHAYNKAIELAELHKIEYEEPHFKLAELDKREGKKLNKREGKKDEERESH